MTHHKLQTLLSSVFTIITALVVAVPANAAPLVPSSGNGLKVSPVVINLTIGPGQSQAVTIYVQNVAQAPLNLQVVANDFTASQAENGQPALLLDPAQYAPSHSLKRYVAPISNITLKPSEQKAVTVNIAIPKTASGGDYYGAIRFAPVIAPDNNNVTLVANVAPLILVRVPGSYKEDLRLASFDVRQGDVGMPQVVFVSNKQLITVVRFNNQGDIQEQPFGKILLKRNGQQVASYEINNTTPRGDVLPDSIRAFSVNLDKVGAWGKYTVVGNFGYGTHGQLLSGSTTFYIIPLTAIQIGVAVIVPLVFFIFVFPKLLRRYNRRVVRRAIRR